MGFWTPAPATGDVAALEARVTEVEEAIDPTFVDATGLGTTFAVEALRVEALYPGGNSLLTWQNTKFTTGSTFAMLIDQGTVPLNFSFAVNALNGSAEFRRNSTSGDLNVRIVAFP